MQKDQRITAKQQKAELKPNSKWSGTEWYFWMEVMNGTNQTNYKKQILALGM